MAANLSGVLLRLASVVVHTDASKYNELGPRIVASENLCIFCLNSASLAKQHGTVGLASTQQPQSIPA